MRRRQKEDPSRRDFMRTAACAAVGTTSLVSTVWDLRMINAAVGQTIRGSTVPAGYKALVCLFLYGGNDSNNLLIPTDTTRYNNYTSFRGPLALPNVGLPGGVLAINPVSFGAGGVDGTGDPTHTYGLHPSCTGIQTLFESGVLAFSCNTGTLVGPVTRAQIQAKTAATPPQLFSH